MMKLTQQMSLGIVEMSLQMALELTRETTPLMYLVIPPMTLLMMVMIPQLILLLTPLTMVRTLLTPQLTVMGLTLLTTQWIVVLIQQTTLPMILEMT